MRFIFAFVVDLAKMAIAVEWRIIRSQPIFTVFATMTVRNKLLNLVHSTSSSDGRHDRILSDRLETETCQTYHFFRIYKL